MENSMGFKMNAFGEIVSNEAEQQDATAALTELDKGLRSPKIGEQCEAIVRFPKIFEKYPFPILINSSFLKLAEFFRVGSNLLRLWVLRVCQQSEMHIEKIINVDEFVKRVFMVIHSNDPIARALTLRTLGSVAGIIPEKEQVHHAIRRALDSNDTVEVEAAILASTLFAAQSKSFAISMCSKVAAMIESLQTPIRLKLQLIPVLKHMHHDTNTAAMVKSLCINLLPKYPAEEFVTVILSTLSQLSCETLVDLPDQVTLLLKYLNDPRKQVRYQVLHSMRLLAQKGAHLWPKGALNTLLTNAIANKERVDERSLVLRAVLALTQCSISCHTILANEKDLVLELCQSCLALENHVAASTALGILTTLVSYCYKEKTTPPLSYIEQIELHIESLIFMSVADKQLDNELMHYLKYGVGLSQHNEVFRDRFLEIVSSLVSDDSEYPTKHMTLLSESLAALGSQYMNQTFDKAFGVDESNTMETDDLTDLKSLRAKSAFIAIVPRLLHKFEAFIKAGHKPEMNRVIETLSAVCFQAMIGVYLPIKMQRVLERVLDVTSEWSQYRIARSASRYGHHYMASIVYERLSSNVSLEKLQFFLTGLNQIAMAECIISYGCDMPAIEKYYKKTVKDGAEAPKIDTTLSLAERLEKAIALYWKALATIKASSSTNHALNFQTDFIRLRGQFLEAIFNLVIIKNTQTITPPPGIAQSLAQTARDYLQKYGHVTNQLRKAVKILKCSEDSYSRLHKSSFDADPSTLEYLEIIQYACAILGHSVETICFVSPSEAPNTPTNGSHPETKYLLAVCRRIKAELLANTPSEQQATQKAITHKHTQFMLNQLEMLMQMSVCIPRYFFQMLQSTSIKLSISPPPRAAGDPVIVQGGSSLVIKVEGVIQHSGKTRGLYRSVDSIHLTLTSQLLTPKAPEFKLPTDTIVLTQTIKPHRDFFTGNFMVALNNFQPGPNGQFNAIPNGGQWQITIEACVIDEDSGVWTTGPRSQFLVRVPEDMTKQINPAVPIRRF